MDKAMLWFQRLTHKIDWNKVEQRKMYKILNKKDINIKIAMYSDDWNKYHL